MPPTTGSYRPTVQRMTRAQLEDAYFRLYDDNRTLKQKHTETEKKLKLSTAKLLKAMSGHSEHSIDMDDLQNKVSNLEKENWLLKNKLRSAKHQLASVGTGSQRRRPVASTREPHSHSPQPPSVSKPAKDDHKDWSIELEKKSNKVKQLNATIETLSAQLQASIDHNRALQQQLKREQNAHQQMVNGSTTPEPEPEPAALPSFVALSPHKPGDTTVDVAEVERVHSQLRNKMMQLADAESKMAQLELNLRTLKIQHDQLLAEFNATSEQLRNEQLRNTHLAQQQSDNGRQPADAAGSAVQTNGQLEAMRREVDTLRESNEKLIKNAFNLEREQQWYETERQLRANIQQLQQTVQADVHVRNELLEKVAAEISSKEQVEEQLRKQEISQLQAKAEHERLEKKLKALTQGGLGWEEVESAVAMLRQGRQTDARLASAPPDFLQPVDEPLLPAQVELDKLKTTYAALVAELDKTRAMLLVQHNINADYQTQLDTLARRADLHKTDYEKQLARLTQLLDQRALRIQRLETTLHDIAYGRHKKQLPITKGVSAEQLRDHPPNLAPGQNLFQIILTKVQMSTEGLRWMQTDSPSFFLTIEFFDFEIQFTPIVTGASLNLDFTCEYTVLMSDLLLHYLETDSVTIELHQATGTNYKTWAAGALYLRDLLRSEDGLLFGSVDLIGVSAEATGLLMACLQFSTRLKLPLATTVSAYKERALALGYLLDDAAQPSAPAAAVQHNTLNVTVLGCQALKSSFGAVAVVSAYVVYSVFDMPAHDTPVLANSNSPRWNDTRQWTLPVGKELNQYLRTQNLRVLVFDDAAETNETALLGVAHVPLVPLANNKPIKGVFALTGAADSGDCGTVELHIEWQHTFIAPTDELVVAQMTVDLAEEKQQPTTTNETRQKPTAASHKPAVIPFTPSRLPVVRPSSAVGQPESVSAASAPVVVETAAAQAAPPPLRRQGSYTIEPGHSQLAPAQLLNAQSFDSSVDSVQANVMAETAQRAASTVLHDTDAEQQAAAEREERQENETEEQPEPAAAEPAIESPSPPAAEPAQPSLTSILAGKDAEHQPKRSSVVPLEPIVVVNNDAADPNSTAPVAAPRRKSKTVEFNEEPEIFQPPPESFDDESDESNIHPPDTKVVTLSIRQLRLNEHSPLLDTRHDDDQVFIQWIFLDLDEEECQTDLSLYLPRDSTETVDFQFAKDIHLNPEQLSSLRSLVHNGDKMRLELLRESGAEGAECEELAVGHLPLAAVYNSDDDTYQHQLQFYDTEGRAVCCVQVSFAQLLQLNNTES